MPAAPAHPEADEIAAFLAAAGLAPDGRILDVPCGIGRRAHGLADRGYRVTAVDPNTVGMEALRRRVAPKLEGRLACHAAPQERLPDLPPTERFDAILCLDHAVGRGAPEADVAFLTRLRGHLAPQGMLLLDILHRDFFAARPRPFAYHVLGDIEQHEFRRFDPVSGRLELDWRFYQREGEDLKFRGTSSAALRLMPPHEVEDLLGDAGWEAESWHGGWAREGVSADRRKLLVVARPSARS